MSCSETQNYPQFPGVSVAVPVDPEKVMEAVFEGLLLREQAGRTDLQLTMFDDFFKPRREELHRDWESAASREKRSRTMFAQQTIKVEAVSQELSEARDAVGSGAMQLHSLNLRLNHTAAWSTVTGTTGSI